MPPKPIRVFYNASALPERPAGAGVYTLELGRALAARDDLALTVAAPYETGFGTRAATPEGLRGRTAWEFSALRHVLARSGAHVYHGPHFFTPKVALPTVATVHDLTFLRLPRRYTVSRRWYYRYLARTATRADRIIVPSTAIAGDVVRFLHVPPARVRVIAEAPRHGLSPAAPAAVEDYRRREGLVRPYLLCLGTAEPGKRAVDAIRAMPRILDGAPGTVLVLAGKPGRLSRALELEAAKLRVSHAVRFLGYVPDADLAPLLTGAEALLFPSIYEGFGLPPLEAMACGTPVIASDAPAMSDVLRGGASLVPVGSPPALALEALRLITRPTLRADRSAAAIEFASGFSWEKAAAETAAVYRELAL